MAHTSRNQPKATATKKVINRTTSKALQKSKKTQSDLFILTNEERKLLDQHARLRLRIELVPTSCWYSNVRSIVKKNQWNRIRKEVYAKAAFLCEVCGEKGSSHPVECHEVWIYEQEISTQRLGSFQSLCPSCHEVKHMGLARLKGNGEKALNRFVKINKLDKVTSGKILSAVIKQWQIRSRMKWKIDVELLKAYDIDITPGFSKKIIPTTKKISTVKNAEPLRKAYQFDTDCPSTITDGYWVGAAPNVHINYPGKFSDKEKSTFKNIDELSEYLNQRKIGKWLVFVDINEIDSTWQKIKKAVKEGILGIGAKAATAKPNPNASSQNEKVICIYTYNWLDKEDVFRVENALRSIGIKQTLYYKANSDTAGEQYKNRGDKAISKYISKGTANYTKFALDTLNGVGYEKCRILNRLGIKTFDHLLSFDTSKKLIGAGVSVKYINKLKLLALSQIENRIFKLSKFQFPKTDILHFDIETDINTPYEIRRVWSIAVHHKNEVKHFYAESWEQERKILIDFLKYLKTCKNTALFSYSSFDLSVLTFAFKRHKLDTDFFLSCNHYDLCAILKQNYILPLNSYSVKEVGRFFGYKYKNQYFDGLMAAMEYMRNQGSGKKISKELLNYIQDDVKVMNHIVEKIGTRKDIKDIFDHDTDK